MMSLGYDFLKKREKSRERIENLAPRRHESARNGENTDPVGGPGRVPPRQLDPNFVIKKEHLPSRCEICHQSDQLNLETGQCYRCSDVSLKLPIAKPRALSTPAEREAYFRRLNAQLKRNQREIGIDPYRVTSFWSEFDWLSIIKPYFYAFSTFPLLTLWILPLSLFLSLFLVLMGVILLVLASAKSEDVQGIVIATLIAAIPFYVVAILFLLWF